MASGISSRFTTNCMAHASAEETERLTGPPCPSPGVHGHWVRAQAELSTWILIRAPAAQSGPS